MSLFERLRKKQPKSGRSIWLPDTYISREKIQQQREELGLSASEVYQALAPLHGKELVEAEPTQNVLRYAADWKPFIVNTDPKVTKNSPATKNNETGEIYLPHPFVTPSKKDSVGNQWGNTQFYWHCYFINKALLASGKTENIQLAKNHIDNFEYLFNLYGYIPNGSKESIVNRTQIPFLSGMIIDVYRTTGDKKWLDEKISLAKREYYEVWMYTDKEKEEKNLQRPSHRISEDSLLIRPVGTDVVDEHYVAAAVTGQDDSSEWAGRAHETAPISLNCAIYKYEKEFAEAARILGKPEEAKYWEMIAEKRKNEMEERMWDEEKGMFVNLQLNRETKTWEKDTYETLNTFMPLWLNMVDHEKAERIMQNLPRFEGRYGLFIASPATAIDKEKLRRNQRIAYKEYPRFIPAANDLIKDHQWDYPNMWAPQEYFAFEGMLNYNKKEDARRVMENILRADATFFQEKGTLPEKIDGLTGRNGKNYQYGDQEGFGWTNAVCQIAAGRILDIAK